MGENNFLQNPFSEGASPNLLVLSKRSNSSQLSSRSCSPFQRLVIFELPSSPNISPSYICPNPDSSTYTMCRQFTQPGIAIIQEDSQGRVLEDLLLNGAPIVSTALWRYNGTIIVTFPNTSLVTCDIIHSPHGPCFEGVQ